MKDPMNQMARAFVAQVRDCFMRSGPSPVFEVQVQDDSMAFNGLKRLKFDVTPTFSGDIPEAVLIDQRFQDCINRALKARPAVLEGKADILVPRGKRRPLVVKDVPWKVKINEILRVNVQDKVMEIESFGYDDFSFRRQGLEIAID